MQIYLSGGGNEEQINNMSIWPHYEKIHDVKINKYITDTGIDVLAIPENGGVYMNRDKLKSIGTGSVYIFNPTKNQID